MKVNQFIEILKMMPDDADVFIQTNPDDYCSLLERKNISVITITDKRGNDTVMTGVAVKLTAYIESVVIHE